MRLLNVGPDSAIELSSAIDPSFVVGSKYAVDIEVALVNALRAHANADDHDRPAL